MPDLMQSAATWLAGKLKNNASQSVTYMRGSQQIGSDLKATYGDTRQEVDTEYGIVSWESKDFIFTAADLTLDGNVIEPQRGDKIVNHLGNVYEALDVPGGKCFRRDPQEVIVRVHTKQVGQ